MTGALEEVLKCWAEEKMPRRKSSLSNGIRTELHYPPSKVHNSSYLARKYPGLWKIQLLPSAFWLTWAVNSSSWWCRSLLLFILLRFTCPCIYKQSSFQSYSSLTCGAEGRNSSMLNLTSVRSCMHTQQFVVNRSWSSSQSTDCRTVPMRKGPFFALVSDDSAVGASQQVNGIERQKPWLCMTLWQAYYVTLKKLLFICFPSILCLLKAVFSLGHHPLPACLSLVSFLLWEPCTFKAVIIPNNPKLLNSLPGKERKVASHLLDKWV